MFRYLVAVGDPTNNTDSETFNRISDKVKQWSAPCPWQTATPSAGVFAAYVPHPFSGDSALLLARRGGLILGSLYRSRSVCDVNGDERVRSLTENESIQITSTRGRSLVTRFWGHYVAFVPSPNSMSNLVLRGPASSLACFHARLQNLNLFFSHPGDYADLNAVKVSINWDSIAAQVVGGDYLTNETAIAGITTLECGQVIDYRPGGNINQIYWDPRSFLADRSLETFAQATRAVRDTADHCVATQASAHRNIVVTLSGGLDSSIVLSCLSRAASGPALTAVNYSSRGPGDERVYARSMAHAADCTLVEFSRNVQPDLRMFDHCNRTARPVLNFSACDVESRNISLAHELHATAIFNGELGDNIFGRFPAMGMMVESIHRHGLGTRFLRNALDYSWLTRRSIWNTLGLARAEMRSLAGNPNFYASTEIRKRYGVMGAKSLVLASREAEERCARLSDRFVHPWLRGSRQLAPGAHMLLFGLITITSTSYHSPFSDSLAPPRVSPFLSQPLIEVALRIPSYLHCANGRDRAVARSAFSDVIPLTVLNRGLGKGGPNLWARDVVNNNHEFLKDFLLDGLLAKSGLVDKAKIEAVLSPRIVKSTAVVGDIFEKLYIEGWLRSWNSSDVAYSPIH